MNDLVWFIIIGILFGLLGLIFIMLGFQIWIKQKMNLIISYHCDKVSEDNRRAYCTLSGVGVFVIGIGFIISGICTVFIHSGLLFLPMAIGLIFGIVLLASAVLKYNH